MKVKGIPFSELKAQALKNPNVMDAYLTEKKEEELQALLEEMRVKAGINSTQVAERMGITQPAVSKLEKNVGR
jgi:DNA-directed RNA polymerase specialized sigma subunit